MDLDNLDFGEYIEFSVDKRFGIIVLNRIHRSNAFTIEQLRNLKNAIVYCSSCVFTTEAGSNFWFHVGQGGDSNRTMGGLPLNKAAKINYAGIGKKYTVAHSLGRSITRIIPITGACFVNEEGAICTAGFFPTFGGKRALSSPC